MKKEYDFSYARRGAVVPSPGKLRITIRLDSDVIEHFKDAVEKKGGGNYQSDINEVLREYISGIGMSEMLRRTVRDSVQEELSNLSGAERMHSTKTRNAVNRSAGGWLLIAPGTADRSSKNTKTGQFKARKSGSGISTFDRRPTKKLANANDD